jgi:uncharacterized membrane protein YesL
MSSEGSGVMRAHAGGLLAGIDRLLWWVVRIVWLNACWVLFVLAGGVLLGAGPATVAAHEIAAAWARGEDVDSVPRSMLRTWRRCWVPANRTAWIAGSAVLSLLLTWMLSRGQTPILAAAAQGLCTVGLLGMAAMIPHLVWLSGVEMRERDRGRSPGAARIFAAALALVVGRPVLTAAMSALWVLWPLLIVLAGWPGLLPVCGASVPLLGAAWCLSRVSVAPHREGASEPSDHHDDHHPIPLRRS